MWSFSAVRHDDPFITYRYAQNLVEGHGLVFNPGETPRVFGATSPGHILLSASVYGMFGTDLTPAIIAALGCAAWSLQAVAVYELLAPLVGVLGASAVALLVDVGAAESFKWVPFETNIAALFALLALIAFRKNRHGCVGLCLALAAVFRPDLLILAALVFCSYVLRDWKGGTRAFTLFLPLVAGWTLFASMYFGTAIPQSAITKFHRASLDAYATHVFHHFGSTVLPIGRSVWGASCAWFLGIVGTVILARRDAALLLLSLYVALHLFAYCYIRPFVEHQWHLYPAMLGGVILAAGGLAWLTRVDAKSTSIVTALALIALICGSSVRSLRAARELPGEYWTGARDTAYRGVASYLANHLHEHDEFAAVEVGTIAYYSNRKAYDLGGLITNLESDPMTRHSVRFVVLDKAYLSAAPAWPVAYIQSDTAFRVYVFSKPSPERARPLALGAR